MRRPALFSFLLFYKRLKIERKRNGSEGPVRRHNGEIGGGLGDGGGAAGMGAPAEKGLLAQENGASASKRND